jgi:hypothetical protein
MVPIKWQFDEGTTCSNRPSGRIPKGPPVGVQPEGATCKQWRCQWQNWRFQLQKTCFFHMVNRKKYYHWIPVDIQWPATHQKKGSQLGWSSGFHRTSQRRAWNNTGYTKAWKNGVRRTNKEPRVALLLCVLNNRFDVFFCIGASLPFKLFTEWRPYERQSNAQQHTANVSLSFDMLEVISTSAVQ